MKAGLARAKAEQDPGQKRFDAQGKAKKSIGRPKVSGAAEAAVRAHLGGGMGIVKVARTSGVGVCVVQRIKAGMTA